MAYKQIKGYVAQSKLEHGFYMTNNQNPLGVLGDQSKYLPSDSVFFSSKKPPSSKVSRTLYKLRQAIKEGPVITLNNHTPGDTKTLNNL